MTQPQELDDYVAAYEAARAADPAARIEDFCPPSSHQLYQPVLRELVRVEMEVTRREGRPRPLADYLRRFPDLAADPASRRELAFEDYRGRLLGGEQPAPAEYAARYGIDTRDWYVPPPPTPADPPVLRVPLHVTGPTAGDLPPLLRRRLAFVSLACTVGFAYFALLAALNPETKVGFSLEFQTSVGLTTLTLLFCGGLAGLLWSRRPLAVGHLRAVELVLFVLVLAYLTSSLASDLFLDHELRLPLAEGDHALFHYASSWSLPFFALAIGYGVLIPSTLPRCAAMVAAIVLVPVALGILGGLAEGLFTASFVQSFVLPVGLWMAVAWLTAVYGAHRLEALRRGMSEARQLGQYRLRRRLGVGGMGEVFLAEHVLLRRPCALKVIRPERAADPTSLRRFEREVQVLATLRHPNTVQIYDYGHAEGNRFYYVMEYVPGVNLEQLVQRDGPLEPGRVVAILLQLTGALRESHAAGLVHRDVKPSNVMVYDQSGLADVVKLLDFGLVQVRGPGADQPRLTGEMLVLGTPAYLSPEQAAGKDTLDVRTDVYSLGAVAYFLLTGQPPFVRETGMQHLLAHLSDPVVPPGRLRPGVPAALEAVVVRCLAKEPGERYPSMAAVEVALRGSAG